MPREVIPEVRVGHHVNVHAGALKPDYAVLRRWRRHPAGRQLRQVPRLLALAEHADPRHHAAAMAAGRQRLHQQTVGFVAPAVGWIVKRILSQQDAQSGQRSLGLDRLQQTFEIARV